MCAELYHFHPMKRHRHSRRVVDTWWSSTISCKWMTTLALLVQVLGAVESEEVAMRQRIPVDTLGFYKDVLK